MSTFRMPQPGAPLLEVEDAQERVLAEAVPVEAESVRFDEAAGRVLRETVLAADDAPRADNSAMDGYAVRFDDLARIPASLRVIGDVPAGRIADKQVEPGTAMRIMTGANVPDGADTVIQVELTDAGSDVVEIRHALPRGANIRRRGEDVRAGATLLPSGTLLGAAEVALLASIQKTEVLVSRRPAVAILSTGDELVEVDAFREPGQIVNSNGYALAALVREAGAIPVNLGIVRDTREATIAAFEEASSCDFILSSGGVSVGAFDFVKDALEALGAESMFWRVAMKPGKPLVLSRLRGRLCFGLPGNPVSCMVSFHLFVAAALRKALGRTGALLPPEVDVRLAAPLKSAGDRRMYVRAQITAEGGVLVATPMTSQSSGAVTSMVGANALVVVPRGVTRIEAGTVARAVVIGPLA